MVYVFGGVIGGYAVACFWLCWQWLRIPKRPLNHLDVPPDFKISVIIPVRNEAAHIGVLLDDLERQTLARQHFEVWVMDDASTDKTAEIVNEFIQKKLLNLQLVSLVNAPVSSPKKRAITEALKRATGQLIITTDGDCRVGASWLEIFAQTYLETGAKLISGPVTFLSTMPKSVIKSGGEIAQTIEFASLIGTGACLLEAGHPTMCNGANLAYERAAFEEVGGFEGVEQIASGDDEFLLQKISKHFGVEKLYFLKNKAAIVSTHAQDSWQGFYHQRIRWASKWAVNKRLATMLVAVWVFLVNLMTLILLIAPFCENVVSFEFCTILLLKYVPEFLILRLIIRFLGRKSWVWYIPIVQLFYPIYVLFFGLAAQRKGYIWKGRSLR